MLFAFYIGFKQILLDKPTKATWDDFDKYSNPLNELGWNLNERLAEEKIQGL